MIQARTQTKFVGGPSSVCKEAPPWLGPTGQEILRFRASRLAKTSFFQLNFELETTIFVESDGKHDDL